MSDVFEIPRMPMQKKDISEQEIIDAVRNKTLDHLVLDVPRKVLMAELYDMVGKGFLDYGASIWECWVTPEVTWKRQPTISK
jgi:hypothetical protein